MTSEHISKFKMDYKITLKLRPNAPSCMASYSLSPKLCQCTLERGLKSDFRWSLYQVTLLHLLYLEVLEQEQGTESLVNLSVF